MAEPTPVNGQITDAVTQANVKVLADAPAMAMGTLYQVLASVTGIGMQNAVTSQQQGTTLGQAATTQGVNLLFSMDPAAAAVSSQDLLSGNTLAQFLSAMNATLASGQQNAKIAKTTPAPVV